MRMEIQSQFNVLLIDQILIMSTSTLTCLWNRETLTLRYKTMKSVADQLIIKIPTAIWWIAPVSPTKVASKLSSQREPLIYQLLYLVSIKDAQCIRLEISPKNALLQAQSEQHAEVIFHIFMWSLKLRKYQNLYSISIVVVFSCISAVSTSSFLIFGSSRIKIEQIVL